MQGQFRHLHFKSFPMTPRTPQWKVFWPFNSGSESSGVPEDSKFPLLGVWASPSHLAQSGVVTIDLSTKMAVPTLILFECPIGMPSFQKEAPYQNSIPLVGIWTPFFPRCCSWIRMICGGDGSEASHSLISLGLDVPRLIPLTLKEAKVKVFSVIS